MAENGGARPGAGRKTKAQELQLIDKLTPYHDKAIEFIGKGVNAGDYDYIKLFMEYFYGKPKQVVEQTVSGNEEGYPIRIWASDVKPESENDNPEPKV